MRVPFRGTIAMLCLFCLLLVNHADVLAQNSVAVTQVDGSQFPAMTLYVNVADAGGKASAPLQKGDFQISEDGAPVTITGFAGLTEQRPVDIVFVFDTTGSMEEQIEGVKETCIAFANQLSANKRDFRLGLIAFGDEIRTVQGTNGELTNNATQFKGWIDDLVADGGWDDPEIALDGLAKARAMRYRPDAQKVLILITDAPPHEKDDGTDFSKVIFADLVKQLSAEAFTVYSISLNDPRYRQISSATGGEFYDLDLESDFTDIIDKIGATIASQYRLTYQSARESYDGTRRNIVVKVQKGMEISEADADWVEPHLINVRSTPWIAFSLLTPLLLALVLPMVLAKNSQRQPPLVVDDTLPPVEPIVLHPVLEQPVRNTSVEWQSEPTKVAGAPSNGSSTLSTEVNALCPHCTQPVRPGAKFCTHCGQSMVVTPTLPSPAPQPPKCLNCGATLPANAKFCSSCGHKKL